LARGRHRRCAKRFRDTIAVSIPSTPPATPRGSTRPTPRIRRARTGPISRTAPSRPLAEYRGWLEEKQAAADERFYTIVDPKSERPLGVAAYLRIAPQTGSIEIGHLSYSPALQRTVASTEAMYRMMKRVFDDWGYRRYEWKCDALNAPSRAAATRLGFRFEGVFRQLMVVKGTQSRHGLVLDRRRGVAGASGGVRGLALARELRRARASASAPRGVHARVGGPSALRARAGLSRRAGARARGERGPGRAAA
jgi:RimJ/RimL family protein N-acetyltransferase